ncbi:dual specificity calcium/calmodulin-dependent 3',5'-cyclic nucleotide phosphodiesterase 1B isoform X2 [Nematostella vectensis]|uniref:dual specificity calcium/calmodulin-dependent 3',5'-cyclic nucleotide phosphodiesterase 1B isoform X2 n=1 Tax=Nematostella vectensis TaxID=45351 RepID=UPI0020772D9A|nr:dual specificity calcium/calmodulin-dependent 3',5'-cyclic nucleotide phosphodiesterase 1B isoform X2 [Nematostella vectensis]
MNLFACYGGRKRSNTVQPLIHVTTASNSSDPNLNDEANTGNESLCRNHPASNGPTAEYFTRPRPSCDYDNSSAVALLRLRTIMRQIEEGQVSSVSDVREELGQALAMIEYTASPMRDYRGSAGALSEIDENLENELDSVNEEVREWIATTFARGPGAARRKSMVRRHTFRGVVHAVKASLYVNKMLKNATERYKMHVPENVQKAFEDLDKWTFDVFALSESCAGHPLRYIGYEVLHRRDMLRNFKIHAMTLDRFLQDVETGYKRHSNPYHNDCHAADVTHTVHYFLECMGVSKYLSDLEVFGLLLSAIIHDLEHTGTTNAFHINSRSDLALLYNDRSVLENHHVSCAFRILQDDEKNILSGLNLEQYADVRSLMIDTVLATDMSSHFEQLRLMKVALVAGSPIENREVVQLLLHVADISNPTKDWTIHRQWTTKIMEEFFTQGDMEIELGLDVSPLCDRSTTLIPESQIGFIDFIVSPALEVCSEVLEEFIQESSGNNQTNIHLERPWTKPLAENRKKWKEQCTSHPKPGGSTLSVNSRTSYTNTHECSDDSVHAGLRWSPRVNRRLLTPIIS